MTVLEEMEKTIRELKAIIPEPQPLLIKLRPEYFEQIKKEFPDVSKSFSPTKDTEIWRSVGNDITFYVTKDAPEKEIVIVKMPVFKAFGHIDLWKSIDDDLKSKYGVKP